MIGERLTRAVLAGAGLAFLGTGGIYTGVKIPQPFLILHQQRVELGDLESRDQWLAEQERALLSDLIYIRSKDGLMQVKHEQGLLGQGERYVRLLPAEKFGPKTVAPPEQPSKSARIRAAARRLGRRVKAAVLDRLGRR
jgi:hypothetical protein